jgi:hypothetical protein
MNTENQELNSIMERLQVTESVNIDELAKGFTTLSFSKPVKNVEISHSKDVQIIRGPYKGQVGEIELFRPALFTIELDPSTKVQYKKSPNQQIFGEDTFQLTKFKADTPQQKQTPRVIITKGVFRGRKGTIVEYKKPNVSVKMTFSNKIVTGINPEDMFYKDIRLHNGDFFYVTTVYKNGDFGGLQLRTPNDTINPSEIHSVLPPFSIREISDEELSSKRDKKTKELQSALLEAGESIKEISLKRQLEEKEEEPQSEEISESIEYLPDEEMLQQLDFDDQEQEQGPYQQEESKENQLVTGFADITRSRFEERPLTNEEEVVLSEVNKLNANDFDQGVVEKEKLRNTAISITDTLEKIYKLEPSVTSRITTDNRYFIAAAFMYEMLSKNMEPSLYIKTLISNSYFSSKNMGPFSNLDSENVWSAFPVISQLPEIALTSDKIRKLRINQQNLKKIVSRFYRALAIVDSMYTGKDEQELKYDSMTPQQLEAIPLIPVEPSIPISFPIQLISGHIPLESKKMVWGPELSRVIEKFKKEKKQQGVDDILLKNLEQFYYFDKSILSNEQKALFEQLVEEMLQLVKPILQERYNKMLFQEYVTVVKSMRNIIKNPIQLEPNSTITYKTISNATFPGSLRALFSGTLQQGTPVDLSLFISDLTQRINSIHKFFKLKKLNAKYMNDVPENLNKALFNLQKHANAIRDMKESELTEYLQSRFLQEDNSEADIIYQIVGHFLIYPIQQFLRDYESVLAIREAKKMKKQEMQEEIQREEEENL